MQWFKCTMVVKMGYVLKISMNNPEKELSRLAIALHLDLVHIIHVVEINYGISLSNSNQR